MSDSLTDEDVDKPETEETTSLNNKTEEKVTFSVNEQKPTEQSQEEDIAKKCENSSKDEKVATQHNEDKVAKVTENIGTEIKEEEKTTPSEVLSSTAEIPVEKELSSEVDTTIISQSIKSNDNATIQLKSSEPHTHPISDKDESVADNQSPTPESPPQQQSSESDVQSLKAEEYKTLTVNQTLTKTLPPPQSPAPKEESPVEKQPPAQETLPQPKSSSVSTEAQAGQTKEETSTDNKSSKTSTAPSKDDHAEHVTYTEDGSVIYTDPQTKYQYKWCTKANNWIPCEAENTTSSNPYENEHYKWCQETQKWLPKQAQVTETEHYKWDAEMQQWIPKKKAAESTQSTDIVYDIDEDGQRIYTDKDGTVYFWDVSKNAWFPKIDDDFMARYQMSYGFIDNTGEAEKEKAEKQLELEAAAALKEKELQKMTEEAKANDGTSQGAGVKRKAQQEPPKWFEMNAERNTKVYVSNLPLDITLDEFTEVMSKCGMIMRDPQTQKYKLKLYTEADGQLKGDGLCDYIKVESVDLALKILDDYELRGHKMRVQRAQFQMRGEYNPALKPKRKKKDKEKLAKIKEKLFDWRPEKMRGERTKNEKTVIIKNLFHPELFENEVHLILDYQNDLREECGKCGSVRKVVIYDRHAEGVAQVNMSSPEEADLVIQMMQGRFFGKRQLTAEHWDGKTKYKFQETEEDTQERFNKWDKFLETEEHNLADKPLLVREKSPENDCEASESCEMSKVATNDIVP